MCGAVYSILFSKRLFKTGWNIFSLNPHQLKDDQLTDKLDHSRSMYFQMCAEGFVATACSSVTDFCTKPHNQNTHQQFCLPNTSHPCKPPPSTVTHSSRAAPKKKHDRGGGDGGSDDGGETSDFESDEPDQPAPKRTSTRACAVDARAAIKLSGLANNAENSDDDDLRSVSEDGEEDGERGSDGEVGVDEIDVGSSEDQAAMWDSTGARLEIQRVVGRVEGMPNMFSLKLVGECWRPSVGVH